MLTLNFYENKNILITGASGYVANNLINTLRNVKCNVLRLSRNSLPVKSSSLAGRFLVKDIIGDIQKKEIWEKALGNIDIIFHLAGQTSIYKAEKDPVKDWKSNVLPILNLLEVCRTKKLSPKIIYSGTVTQVGMTSKLPVNESFSDMPITFYDIHKLMAEDYLKFYCNQGNAQGVSLRFPNIYGPGVLSSSADRGVINMMIQKALNGESLTIYGDGRFIRDYLYIDDLISALLLAGKNVERLNGNHYVLGTGQGYSIKESINKIAKLVGKKLGTPIKVSSIPQPEGMSPIENRNFIGDFKAFAMLTNWMPTSSFEQGVMQTIEYISSMKKV